MVTNDFFGIIDCPEFYANIEGELTDNLYLKNIVPIMQERSINSQFFKSITHITNLYPISGSLERSIISR